MGKKFKIGMAVTAGAAVAFIFARGVKAIIDDIDDMSKANADDDMFEDEDEEDIFEDDDLMAGFDKDDDKNDGKEDELCADADAAKPDECCDGACGNCKSHENYTEADDTCVDEPTNAESVDETNADEAAEQTVSSDNIAEA